jgi:hypothetical protein
MKYEAQLKIQAHLDGELSAAEAREVAALLAENPQAQALLAELTRTRALVRQNEPEIKLPESRDFYWNKIQTAIERQGRQTAGQVWDSWNWVVSLRKYLLPISGFALVALLALSSLPFSTGDSVAEVENIAPETTSISFRDHSDKMFVVWISTKDADTVPDMDEDEEVL